MVADWLRDAYDADRDCKSGQGVAATKTMFKGVRDGALGTEGVMSFPQRAAFLFGCRAGAAVSQ